MQKNSSKVVSKRKRPITRYLSSEHNFLYKDKRRNGGKQDVKTNCTIRRVLSTEEENENNFHILIMLENS